MAGPPDIQIDVVDPNSMELGMENGMPVARPINDAPVVRQRAREEVEPDLVANLRKQYEQAQSERDQATQIANTEREARERAEASADKNYRVASNAHWRAVNAEHEKAQAKLGQLQQAIQQTKDWAETAKQHLAAAEADETAPAADRAARKATAAEAIARATTYLTGLEGSIEGAQAEVSQAKAQVDQTMRAYEQQRQQQARQPPQQTEQRKPTANDFIQAAPENTRQWLRDHKEYAEPGSKEQRKLDIFVAQWLLDHSDDRDTLNSRDFLNAVDGHFFPTQENDVADDPAPAPTPAARAPAAAPVSRSSNPRQPGSDSRRIQLTPEQFAIAPELYPTYESLSEEAKAMFPAWSETAARWQYNHYHKQAQADGKYGR